MSNLKHRVSELEKTFKPQQAAMTMPELPDDPVEASRLYCKLIREDIGVAPAAEPSDRKITKEEAERAYREFIGLPPC